MARSVEVTVTLTEDIQGAKLDSKQLETYHFGTTVVASLSRHLSTSITEESLDYKQMSIVL